MLDHICPHSLALFWEGEAALLLILSFPIFPVQAAQLHLPPFHNEKRISCKESIFMDHKCILK